MELGTSGAGDTNTGYSNLAIVDVATGTAHPLANYAGSPSWSPDGRYIAFVDFDPEHFTAVSRIRPDGLGRRVLYQPPGSGSVQTDAVDWSPDGRRIAFVRRGHETSDVLVVGRKGGRVHRVTGRPATRGIFSGLAWSPSGRRLVFGAYDGKRDSLFTVSASGGRQSRIQRGGIYPSWQPLP